MGILAENRPTIPKDGISLLRASKLASQGTIMFELPEAREEKDLRKYQREILSLGDGSYNWLKVGSQLAFNDRISYMLLSGGDQKDRMALSDRLTQGGGI